MLWGGSRVSPKLPSPTPVLGLQRGEGGLWGEGGNARGAVVGSRGAQDSLKRTLFP